MDGSVFLYYGYNSQCLLVRHTEYTDFTEHAKLI